MRDDAVNEFLHLGVFWTFCSSAGISWFEQSLLVFVYLFCVPLCLPLLCASVPTSSVCLCAFLFCVRLCLPLLCATSSVCLCAILFCVRLCLPLLRATSSVCLCAFFF